MGVFPSDFSALSGASRLERSGILEEFSRVCGYNRKYAIRKLSGPPPGEKPRVRRRGKRRPLYGPQVIAILRELWEAGGYPWSVRLKAMVPVWMPWIRRRYHTTPELEGQILSISPRQIDRRLKSQKVSMRRRLYGRTKPGTLLKHQIRLRTDHWDVKSPGFAEVDLVSHSGNCGEGVFVYSLNTTDILSGWVESPQVWLVSVRTERQRPRTRLYAEGIWSGRACGADPGAACGLALPPLKDDAVQLAAAHAVKWARARTSRSRGWVAEVS